MLFESITLRCLKACQIPYRKGNKVILLKVNHFSQFSQAHSCRNENKSSFSCFKYRTHQLLPLLATRERGNNEISAAMCRTKFIEIPVKALAVFGIMGKIS